jgi:hypothetical protein
VPRTEVYQLRLHPQEKGRLARKAEERGTSIARMIRQDYGLDAETKLERDPSKPLGDNPDLPPEHSASEIKRLARQKHAHLPLASAEWKVKHELKEEA